MRIPSDTETVCECPLCQKPMSVSDMVEAERYDGVPVHSDCYYSAIGNIVEQNPIPMDRK